MSLHVLPVADRWEHKVGVDCWCRPRVEHIERPDGRWGRLVLHVAADGRDPIEPVDDCTDSATP